MTIFPQTKMIRRVSSAPTSPIVFNSSPTSPTSIIAIKSPVERGGSKRVFDPLSLLTPFTVAFPEESDAPPVPPIPAWVVPPPSIKLRIPPVPVSLPPVPKGPVIDPSTEICPPVKTGGKQRRSFQAKPNPRTSFRRTNSNLKRVASGSTRRLESSTGRPYRRLMLKRDSGMPFADHAASVAGPIRSLLFPQSQPEGVETKEVRRRSTKRWSASRRFLLMSNRKPKATVVTMKKGKGEVEESDIVAVIPQLRELKAPKRSRW